MTLSLWLITIAILFCVAISAFFSGLDAAFTDVSRSWLSREDASGNARARTVLRLLENEERLQATILIGKNLANLTAAALGTLVLVHLTNAVAGVLLAVFLLLALLLFLREILSKEISIRSSKSMALFAARPLCFLTLFLKPLSAALQLWRRMLQRTLKPSDGESHIEDDLMTMLDEAQSEGDMDAHEGELIRSAIAFNDMDAIDILTPRVDITALEDTSSTEKAAALFRESGYSRVPVYHEDMDHIVGILHEKDFYMRMHEGVRDIRSIMTPPVYAPSSIKNVTLLKLFQSSKTHMVILLDEFGGTEGLVTMEDVLEELVGEIYDEHDDVEEEIRVLEDGSFLVDGGMHLSELLERFQAEDTYDADTAGGWAAEMLGCIPHTGDSFDADAMHCQVTAMDKRRVMQLRIWKKDPNPQEDSPR